MPGQFVDVMLLYKLKSPVRNLRLYPSTSYSPLGSDIFIITVFLKYAVAYVLIHYESIMTRQQVYCTIKQKIKSHFHYFNLCIDDEYVITNAERKINPLNAELNPFCHLLALLETHHFLHVSR